MGGKKRFYSDVSEEDNKKTKKLDALYELIDNNLPTVQYNPLTYHPCDLFATDVMTQLHLLADILFSSKAQHMYWKMLNLSNGALSTDELLAQLMYGKTISKTKANESYFFSSMPGYKSEYDFPLWQHILWDTRAWESTGGYHRWSLPDNKLMISAQNYLGDPDFDSSETIYFPIINFNNLPIGTLIERYLTHYKKQITLFSKRNERIVLLEIVYEKKDIKKIKETIKTLGIIASPWEIAKFLVKNQDNEKDINDESSNFRNCIEPLTTEETNTLQTLLLTLPATITELKQHALLISLAKIALDPDNPVKLLASCLHRLISALSTKWAISAVAIKRISLFLSIGILFHNKNYNRFAFILYAITHEISLILNQTLKSKGDVSHYNKFARHVTCHFMQSFQLPLEKNAFLKYNVIVSPANTGCHAFIMALEFVRNKYENPIILGCGPIYYEFNAYIDKQFNPFKKHHEIADVYCISVGPTCGHAVHPGMDINVFINNLITRGLKKRSVPITLIVDTTGSLEKNIALDDAAQRVVKEGYLSIICIESYQKFGLAHTDQVQGGVVFGVCSTQLFDEKSIKQFNENAHKDFAGNLDMRVVHFIFKNTQQYLNKIKEMHYKNGEIFRQGIKIKRTHSNSGSDNANEDFLFAALWEEHSRKIFDAALIHFDFRQGFGHYNTTVAPIYTHINRQTYRLCPSASDAIDTLVELAQLKLTAAFTTSQLFALLQQFNQWIQIHSLTPEDEIVYVGILMSVKNKSHHCEINTKYQDVIIEAISLFESVHPKLLSHRKCVQTLQDFKIRPTFFTFDARSFLQYLKKLPDSEAKSFIEKRDTQEIIHRLNQDILFVKKLIKYLPLDCRFKYVNNSKHQILSFNTLQDLINLLPADKQLALLDNLFNEQGVCTNPNFSWHNASQTLDKMRHNAKCEILKEKVNSAIIGRCRTLNALKAKPSSNMPSYLGWKNTNAIDLVCWSIFSQKGKIDKGEQYARELLIIANDSQSTYEIIVNKIYSAIEEASTHTHGLSRYLMAQLTNQEFAVVEQLSENDFVEMKSKMNQDLLTTVTFKI